MDYFPASGLQPPRESAIDVGELSIGVKWRLVEAAPIVGDFAMLPSIKVPSASADAGTGTTDLGLLLISSHAIGQFAIDLNAGYTHRGGERPFASRDVTVWTASIGGPARGPLGWVAEVFGYPAMSSLAGEASIVAFLGGPTVRVRKWLVLDGGVILPLTGPQPRALYLGAVYNVGRVWTHETVPGDHVAALR